MSGIGITISDEFLAVSGTNSLLGKVLEMISRGPKPTEITLMFQKPARNITVKQFTIPCLIQDILRLQQMGYIVRLDGEY